jgi:hypothetical protein
LEPLFEWLSSRRATDQVAQPTFTNTRTIRIARNLKPCQICWNSRECNRQVIKHQTRYCFC